MASGTNPTVWEVSFGRYSNPKNVIGERGLALTLAHGQQTFDIDLPLVGLHNAWNAASAMAVAFASDVALKDAAQGLRSAAPAQGRLQVRHLQNPANTIWTILTTPIRSLWKWASKLCWQRQGSVIPVLGEMLELGEFAEAAHRSLGALVAQSAVEAL